MRSLAILVLALALVLTFCGCGADGGSPDGGISLTVSSNDPMTSAGDTRIVTAVATVPDLPASPTLSWSTSAPAVASVSGSGTEATITAVGDGTAAITATIGSLQGTITVTVSRVATSLEVTPSSAEIPPGSTLQLRATAFDARHNEIRGLTSYRYSSSNPNFAIVSPEGLVTGLFACCSLPAATITTAVASDGGAASATTDISVREPFTFDHAALMLSEYERPTRVPTLASGIAFFTIDRAESITRIKYKVTWSAASSPAISVHIHGPGDFATVADVLVVLPITSQTDGHGVLTGSFTAADIVAHDNQPAMSLEALIELMNLRDAYVDVHTAAFVDGELRGQIFGGLR